MLKKVLLGFVIVIALLLLLTVVRIQCTQDNYSNKLKAELERLRAAGEPISFAELMAGAKAPVPGEGAGGKVLEFVASLNEHTSFSGLEPNSESDPSDLGRSKSDLGKLWESWTPEKEANARILLESNQALLQQAHELLKLPQEEPGTYLHLIGQRADSLDEYRMPDLRAIRMLSDLLGLETTLAYKSGDFAKATEFGIDELQWGRHLEMMAATTIGCSVANTAKTSALRSVGRLLQEDRLSEHDLQVLRQALDQPPQAGLETALIGERIASFEITKRFPEEYPLLRYLPEYDQYTGLTIKAESIRIARMPYWETKEPLAALESRIDALDVSTPGTALSTPNVTRLFEDAAKTHALWTIATLAVSLRQYEHAHNKFPETLAELAPTYQPQSQPDPFSGSPLIYRREGDKAVIYSVGTNRIDDGGEAEEKEALLLRLSP